MKNKFLFAFVIFCTFCHADNLWAQSEYQEVKDVTTALLKAEKERQVLLIGNPRADSVSVIKKIMHIFCNDNAAYLSFREENVQQIYDALRQQLPSAYQKYKIQLWADGRPIEQHVPAYYRTGKDKALRWAPRVDVPLKKCADRPYGIRAGMQDRHIAIWQSHGWYYEQKLDRWEWQRGRLLQTVEDLYTQSYVLPFLVPMLENAGANVLLPRERDVNRQEYILDNDGGAGEYAETVGQKPWQTGNGAGFAHRQAVYRDFQNPFLDGTFRQAETQAKGSESVAEWKSVIRERGEYAVYVSYKTVRKSTRDALYTVYHSGGETHFRINQQMAGGTWVYLGTFLFADGQTARVTLSNLSEKAGQIVTADAVKIGGGMGNIERAGLLSGYPRFTEGSRYWLQWAGAPDSVYSMKHGEDDYTDDYVSRPRWVNWLAGGSAALPKRKGLNVPIDLSMAFHSDAGVTKDDGIIGTLVIHKTIVEGRDTYANGASRYLAAELADLIQTQIVNDVRATCAPEWSRRGKWNSSYAEARVPEVPAILLELLSHQNFADMRYGLDPRFRFTVSRAIYKGMLKFLCSQRGTPYVVQPLPVSNMRVGLSGNEATLQWQAVADSLEPSATPHSYMVYTRMDGGGWDNGQLVTEPSYQTTLQAGHIYSWKVSAVNDGGCSFDSEILSAGLAPEPRKDIGTVLVINGFDRVSAPADFDITQDDGVQLAGFRDDYDHGVPYLRDISYIGQQKEFRRSIPWMDDDASGFGDSYADQEDRVIAGNTFDYPFVHGQALIALGCSFTSCSNEAVESAQVSLSEFPMVDLILGKQCQTKMGNGKTFPLQFKTFSPAMQQQITQYLQQTGGRFFVSGAYVGTDLWDNPLAKPIDSDKKFATDVLKFQWRANQAVKSEGIKQVRSAFGPAGGHYSYSDTLNAQCYVVESPDAIEPAGSGAHTVLRYAQSNLSAAVAYRGEKYSTFIMGVPFEAVTDVQKRRDLMQTILQCLFP